MVKDVKVIASSKNEYSLRSRAHLQNEWGPSFDCMPSKHGGMFSVAILKSTRVTSRSCSSARRVQKNGSSPTLLRSLMLGVYVYGATTPCFPSCIPRARRCCERLGRVNSALPRDMLCIPWNDLEQNASCFWKRALSVSRRKSCYEILWSDKET